MDALELAQRPRCRGRWKLPYYGERYCECIKAEGHIGDHECHCGKRWRPTEGDMRGHP